jgi:hypothetical protein
VNELSNIVSRPHSSVKDNNVYEDTQHHHKLFRGNQLMLQMKFKELKEQVCQWRLSTSLATDDEGSLVQFFERVEQKKNRSKRSEQAIKT